MAKATARRPFPASSQWPRTTLPTAPASAAAAIAPWATPPPPPPSPPPTPPPNPPPPPPPHPPPPAHPPAIAHPLAAQGKKKDQFPQQPKPRLPQPIGEKQSEDPTSQLQSYV